MYALLKNIHSLWAYLTLALLFIALLNAWKGRLTQAAFQNRDLRLSLFGLIVSHIQLLLGLILYFVSPWFDQWSQGMAIMKDPQARLYLVEHPLTNILALFFITLGWSLHKRQETDTKRFSRIAVFYTLGTLLLLSRIPWDVWF
jgi:hypothetical protein